MNQASRATASWVSKILVFSSTLLLAYSMAVIVPSSVRAESSEEEPAAPLIETQQGSAGLQGVVPTPPPEDAPSITTPSSGQSFSRMPITINGLCTDGLIVKLFANDVFIGSALCSGGSYTLQADLSDGQNDLVARVYDGLDQSSPDSSIIRVNYKSDQFAGFGLEFLSLSSIYARRGANPGEQLNWPITIVGGSSPYALSVDWGDGKPASLQSQQFAGNVTISHVYDTAGTYVVIVRATDKNGQIAFLQLVGQANGAIAQSSEKASQGGLVAAKTSSVWIPAIVSLPLILITFWLGRRFEVDQLRKRLERQDK